MTNSELAKIIAEKQGYDDSALYLIEQVLDVYDELSDEGHEFDDDMIHIIKKRTGMAQDQIADIIDWETVDDE